MNHFTPFEIMMMVAFLGAVVFIAWPYFVDHRSQDDKWTDEVEKEAYDEGKLDL